MSQTKKVGIVVPIYNVEKYLRQCLESIIHQTYKDLEILLINDGSTDSSLKIAKEYAQKDSRITIINKANGGQANARNAGIEFFTSARFKVMDLRSAGEFANANARHESRCDSRNDEKITTPSLRGEAEAIHHVDNQKIFNGEISNYGLPRDSSESLAMTEKPTTPSLQGSGVEDTLVSRHCERSEAIHHVDNQKILNGEIQDYRLPRDSSESLAMTQSPSPRDDAEALHSYGIIGENPYQIYAIYSLKSSLEIPQIDYLQFVDSDDYIELDCVEKCVPRMQGVDVLWFDVETLLDGVKKTDWKSNLHFFNYNKEVVISRKDWAVRLFYRQLDFFYFAVFGMIDFAFLKRIKLKFLNGIIQEDDMFGILLFAQSNFIYVYPQKLYHYRIRANSIMNYGEDYSAKVAGFFAKSAEVFRDNYSKRAYHKASSFMQTSLALNNFLQNTQEERVKHIISHYIMPTYVFYAHKILYFAQDPLNLIPKFQGLQEYLENFKNSALAKDLLKEEIAYRLGSATLSLLKNRKNLLSLPKMLYQIIQNNKESKKAYQANLKNYALDLPNFKSLISKADLLKIKQHLSYQLGVCILNAHKMRYLGGYLWLPFSLILTLTRFKLSAPKRELNSVFFSSMDKLNREISHLSWQIYHTKDTGTNSSDSLAHLQSLGEFADIFLQAKDKLTISYTKDTKLLNLLLECKAEIHHFEADCAFCEILREKYKESPNVTFYHNALSCVESTQIYQRENQGSGITPSVFYANHQLYEAKGLKMSEVLQRFPNLYLLVIDLDFETCELLEWLLDSKEYQKISYIFCKVNRIFGESKKFESLKQKIDSTPPPRTICILCEIRS
ncbi:glycosyltransferase family 2 protein [Helicobacter rodentium]|uniref:glycosyltransferase family 2 protein n=2 Tax=Helicobacter rodentium TaxID=59617 RepID=UPI0023F4ACD5|nr:glycosyltransferase family 2 protein [Helicobacter rodentium]